MESVRINADWQFLRKHPFGFLMSMQTVLSLCVIILLISAQFRYEGMNFVNICACTLFFSSLMYNIFHVIGWNRKVLQLSAGINLFVPCTLWVFSFSIIFLVLFGFNTLLCLIGFFDSFRYTVRLIITYALLCMACASQVLVCLRLAVLLFRAAPNSQIMGLMTVIIDGDGTSRMEGSAPQFSPVSTPGPNPV